METAVIGISKQICHHGSLRHALRQSVFRDVILTESDIPLRIAIYQQLPNGITFYLDPSLE